MWKFKDNGRGEAINLNNPFRPVDVEAPIFSRQSQMAVRLSAWSAGRSLCPGWFLNRTQGHIAGGRIRSIEKSNDEIGIRNQYLQAFSTAPQPAMFPFVHKRKGYILY
jgi:hypothetical protein